MKYSKRTILYVLPLNLPLIDWVLGVLRRITSILAIWKLWNVKTWHETINKRNTYPVIHLAIVLVWIFYCVNGHIISRQRSTDSPPANFSIFANLNQRTGYTMYKKLVLSKVEKLKTTIFPSGDWIILLNIPHVLKWFPFRKMHERLVILEFKIGALIRIFINFRVIYDV